MINAKHVLAALALAGAALSVTSAAHADGPHRPNPDGGRGPAALGSTLDDLLGVNNVLGTTAPGGIGNNVDCLLDICNGGGLQR